MKRITFLLMINILMLGSSYSQCSSSGSHNGSSFTTGITSGTLNWSTPSNAITSNTIASVATISMSSNTTVQSDYLFVSNFNFNIPANAAICGISVKLEKMQSGANASGSSVVDNTVQLRKNGTFVGNNLAFAWPWTNYYANIVYGGSGQNWGYNWKPAEINSPNFGVGISASIQNGGTASTISTLIDHVAITVFYTIPLPVEWGNITCESSTNKVLIHWNTLSETNNFQFIVEKSTDAIHWVSVDSVMAIGHSNQQNDYEGMDYFPTQGVSYYRIAQVNLDGSVNYSSITSHQHHSEWNNQGVHVNYLNEKIVFGTESAGTLELKCVNLFGTPLLKTQDTLPDNGIVEVAFKYSGAFVVVYTLNGESGSVKFMGMP